MHHTEYFERTVYSIPDLGKALVRRALRAGIYARIVLSDINELRFDMLQRVLHFKLNKPQLRNNNAENKKKKKKKQKEMKWSGRSELQRILCIQQWLVVDGGGGGGGLHLLYDLHVVVDKGIQCGE